MIGVEVAVVDMVVIIFGADFLVTITLRGRWDEEGQDSTPKLVLRVS